MARYPSHTTPWQAIARYARMAPSPHNTQPFRLRVADSSCADIVFLPRRGLPAGDPLGRFTWLTAGIFAEICAIAAHAMGFELDAAFQHRPMYAGGDLATPQVVARLTLRDAGTNPVADLDPQLILDRHTSRLAYDGAPCPPEVIAELQAEAARFGHSFETRSDSEAIRWVVELNKQALFTDMNEGSLRTELIKWLRFSTREEGLTNDGLSARCMTFNGPLLRSFFLQHRLWTMPGVRDIVGAVYGATMKGIGTIGWLRGRYVDSADWVVAGRAMIRLWLMLTRHGFYWHPYGSVITSEKARTNMVRYLDLPDEANGEKMVWLLLRLGRSGQPPLSHRLPIEDILLCAP
jgi:hypothetical protein